MHVTRGVASRIAQRLYRLDVGTQHQLLLRAGGRQRERQFHLQRLYDLTQLLRADLCRATVTEVLKTVTRMHRLLGQAGRPRNAYRQGSLHPLVRTKTRLADGARAAHEHVVARLQQQGLQSGLKLVKRDTAEQPNVKSLALVKGHAPAVFHRYPKHQVLRLHMTDQPGVVFDGLWPAGDQLNRLANAQVQVAQARASAVFLKFGHFGGAERFN